MKKLILIVEDEKTNLKLLKDLLQISGYSTLEARDGRQGIKLAHDKKPNLILMDIQLPEIDGVQAIRILKQDNLTKDIPIIAITAFAMEKDKEMALQAGCNGFLSKPIDIKEFLEKVETNLKNNE